ncbi:MBL fold metallo-hydrolase [Sedimentibacter sp. zth1]|uniref:MBL fold metallo-hydrolase RNA specificity domain-containing protein n=1 Tax=Sedimentibacter sp. zth1 TaxID=2816908 RepID=UPI001A911CA5|nr:MBL fold metallo-hydrolase [Sedimentibacter sp. zth1]QSX04934.1 MBL fold metallo-hydrolase [Sedimentibacter sp. zth1]
MNLNFYGAVESVTGSCHLLQFNNKKILLDCGQFQGSKHEEQMNFDEFEFNPSEIDYLLLSHSHIDHCGRIPLLVKRGFKGDIICTKPTCDLCEIMLLDSAHIHESEAEWLNRKGKRAGREYIEPLYTQQDAINSIKYFKTCLYGQMIKLDEDLTVRFTDAGHILGSAIIEIWIKEENTAEPIKLVFSGDLGTEDKPILKNPNIIDKADYLIMESTYGNRLHEKVENKITTLIDIILKTARRGGNIVIPSFAVGRTQEIIYELNKYYDGDSIESQELRNIPVYIDSPLATKTTNIFKINSQVFDNESRQFLVSGNNPLEFRNLHFVMSPDESKELNFDNTPKIIISASGMCEAGRIKHHLKHNLWRKESSVIFVGYQAENTLGRKIKDGEKKVRIFGEDINVEAEIYEIEGFSGHADKNGLINWLKAFDKKPKKVFIVHGEKDSKESLSEELNKTLNIECIIPEKSVEYKLEQEKLSVIQKIKYAHSEPKSMQVADIEKVRRLQNKLGRLQCLFDDAIVLADDNLNESVSLEQYNKINNQLIEVENSIMNLTILSGK